MKQLIRLALFMLLAAGYSFAQTGIIKGKVTDNNGDPIAKVLVEVYEHNMSASTNSEGEYILNDVPVGRTDVFFSAEGYNKGKRRSIRVKENKETKVNYRLRKGRFPQLSGYQAYSDGMDIEDIYTQHLGAEAQEELDIIKELDPEKFKDLRRNVYFKAPNVDLSRLKGLTYTKEKQEQKTAIIELELKTERLGLQYKSGKGDLAQIKNELKVTLQDLFDLKEKIKEDEIVRMESELEELKNSMNIRKKNKSKIIDLRLEQLIGAGKHLRW